MLSKRTKNLKASPTLALLARARELAAKGHDVVALTVGEPDWATFPVVAEAGKDAIDKGITKYTPANGTVEFRKIISDKFNSDYGVQTTIKQVTVASGAKYIIFSALQVLCDEENEVIIGAPYWVSYPTMIELTGAKARIVQTNETNNYKVLASDLQKNINSKTKVFLFCSPSNPTGLAYSRAELEEIAQVLRDNPHVYVISDDMYNRLMLNGDYRAVHLLDVAPDLADRIVCINGGSKAYSMTGWRIGWGVGPEKIIAAMTDYQSQSTGSASSISQYAAGAAVLHCEEDIRQVGIMLANRYSVAVYEISKIPQFKLIKPDGAFYLWIDVRSVIGKEHEGELISSAKILCDILLEKYFVSIIPGNECGMDGFVRLSFAANESLIVKAISRMADLCKKLK